MITDPYMNSTNVTARNLDAQRAAADLEWIRGFGACQFATCAYADLPNEDQRQGWRAAERAAGEAAYQECMGGQAGWTDWRELSNDILAEKGIRA